MPHSSPPYAHVYSHQLLWISFGCPRLYLGNIPWIASNPIDLVFIHSTKEVHMVEALLSGIVLGLIPVTLAGLFVTAYLQYRRGDQLNL